MALFGFSKEKKEDGSSDQVLAYLEEALRRRVPFLLVAENGRECPAHLHGIGEAEGTLSFLAQDAAGLEKGAKLTAVFILDGLRIGGSCRCHGIRPGQVDASLPESLALMERRKRPRARFNPKEGATLTALSGLFEGVGMTGVIENLSEGGARVRLERAMEAKGEKKLGLHAGLVAPGHAFDLVRISKLPKIPGKYECPGKATYMDSSAGSVVLGLAFAGLPSELLPPLRSLVSSRAVSSPSTLPPKTRRGAEEAPLREAPEPPVQPPPQELPPPPKPAPPAPAGPLPPADAPAVPEAPIVPEAASPPRNLALLRLKKRARTLLVASPDPEAGERLRAFLVQEGYGKVLGAGTLGELLGALEEPGIAMLLIDGGVAEAEGLDLLDTLHRVLDELPPVVLALEELSAEDVLAASQAGVAHLRLKPFEPDEGFGRTLEDLLGL